MSERLPVPAPGESTLAPEADAAIDAARALLAHPALAQDLGIAVLARMALDDKVPPKERRRCGEVLLNLKVKAIEVVGALTGSRERHLRALGISQAPQEVHVEQHNTRIEIVREGQRDWRTAEAP